MSASSTSPQDHQETPRPRKRRRVAIACYACRDRKSRCDGARPQCRTCRDFGAKCEYQTEDPKAGDPRIRRDRPRLKLESRLNLLEEQLRRMSRSQLDESPRVLDVEGVAPSPPVSCELADDGHSSNNNGTTVKVTQELAVDDDIQDSVDGLGAVVLDHGVDGCGFFGPTSNITLIRQIAHTIQKITSMNLSNRRPGSRRGLSIEIFRRERSKTSAQPETARVEALDMYALPPDEISWKLMRAFFSTMSLFVPCLHEETFIETYRRGPPFRRSWLGILNLVFAVSTVAESLGLSPRNEEAAVANLYYQRALALSNPQIMRGTSLEIVQFLVLMETYLQGSQRSVQTWTIHGLTVEAAFQAGLHSTEALQGLPMLEQEMRKRTWFCCLVNDRLFSITFGRPALIPEAYSKMDLPIDISKEFPSRLVSVEVSSMSCSCLKAEIALASITDTVIEQLFNKNLDHVQNVLNIDLFSRRLSLCWRLADWQDQLPGLMRVIKSEELAKDGLQDIELLRFRVFISMRYLNIRILLHRPILARILSTIGSATSETGDYFYLAEQGVAALKDCQYSCREIIGIAAIVLERGKGDICVCGAWWLISYYIFHASLVLFNILLVCKESLIPLDFTVATSRKDIDCAINVLQSFHSDNNTARSCLLHITRLCEIYDTLICSNPSSTLPEPATEFQIGAPQQLQEQQYPGDPEKLYQGLSNMEDLGVTMDSGFNFADIMMMTTKNNYQSGFYPDRDLDGMDLSVSALNFM